MSGEVLGERVFEKEMPDKRFIRGLAQLVHYEGNATPHFSLTGEVWRSRAHYRRGADSGLDTCGAIGDMLAEVFPELDDFAPLHSADDKGAPSYAVENGWYWYSDYDGRGGCAPYESHSYYNLTPHQRAARYLRIDPDDLPEDMPKEEFAEFIDTLRPQWAQEADRARAVLGIQPKEDEAC